MDMVAAHNWWLEEKVEGWKYLVDIMTRVACKHLQTAYAGLQKSLQKEWDFVQCAILDTGKALHTVEDALREVFLPALFRELFQPQMGQFN